MTAVPSPTPAPAPSVRRRLASMLYEGMLLFGVLFVAEYLFARLTRQTHALYLRQYEMGFLFVVLGAYFGWCWSHGGQTLAMKTWRIRVVRQDGGPLSLPHALLRYVAAWLWFLPPLLALQAIGIQTLRYNSFVLVAAWLLAYAWIARANAPRQFLHDLLCGTRLIDTQPRG